MFEYEYILNNIIYHLICRWYFCIFVDAIRDIVTEYNITGDSFAVIDVTEARSDSPSVLSSLPISPCGGCASDSYSYVIFICDKVMLGFKINF